MMPASRRAVAAASMPGAVRQCHGGLAEQETRRRPLFHVRQVRPTDASALIRMHERCSLATRYSRWLAPSSIFPPVYLRSVLAGAPQHIAIVAVRGGRASDVIGLASAALTSGGRRELGFLIEDHYQGQGIGRLMLNYLMDLIGRDEDLCVSALFENHWLFGKLSRFGTVVTHLDNGIIEARVTRAPR